MHRRRPCPPDEYLEAIAAGPPDPAARGAPPGPAQPVRRLRRAARRRHRRLGRRLPRHRRPREPRAALARPRPPARGHRGRAASRSPPGSPSTPSTSLDPDRWLDPAVRFAVLDRSDAEGLGRDDPGAVFPQQITAASPQVGDGAEVVPDRAPLHRSGTPGADVAAARARARARRPGCRGAVGEVLDGVLAGQEVGERRDRHAVLGPRPRGGRGRRGRRRAAPGRPSATSSPSSATATSTTRTSARSSAGSAAFSKGPLSLNLRGTPYLLDARGHRRRACVEAVRAAAPPRCACRAASTPTSTATTTSTSPGP